MTVSIRSGVAGLVSAAALMTLQPSNSPASGDTDGRDYGTRLEDRLEDTAQPWFGFSQPLEHADGERNAATDADNVAREVATAYQRQLLVGNLKAKFVARNVALLDDMISFWPNNISYTHLIVCIEQGREVGAGNPAVDGENPGVQRINVATGDVETIL
jgi:hypothetical protein